MVRIDPERLSIPPDGRPEEQQPGWRQDFPIDWPKDDYMARRDFTKFLVLTSFALTVGQFWIVVQNFSRRSKGQPLIRRIATLNELTPGKSLVFSYPEPDDHCILTRLPTGGLVAYSQKCTHLSCAVKPEPGSGRYHCPCHEGWFDMTTGAPLAGPPRRPLPRITLEIRGNDIYATGVELRTS